VALSELVNQRINFNDFDADFTRNGVTRLHEFPSLRCMVVCPTIAGIPFKNHSKGKPFPFWCGVMVFYMD
jgi:hypothetical protein